MNAKWICPAVTPLHSDGTLDFDSAARLYHQLARCGLDGVLVGGSLGEFFSQPIAQRESFASQLKKSGIASFEDAPNA